MAKMPLPAAAWLVNRQEDDEFEELRGDLRCPCGCDTFRVYHSGKRPTLLSRLFSGERIWPEGAKTLAILAKCSACGKGCWLHCDEPEGDGWQLPEEDELTEFVHPRLHDQRLRLSLIYYWEWKDEVDVKDRAWHIGYSGVFVYGCNDEHPKRIGIFD